MYIILQRTLYIYYNIQYISQRRENVRIFVKCVALDVNLELFRVALF